MAIRYQEICLKWWKIVRIFFVIELIFAVIRIRLFHRLTEGFFVFFECEALLIQI